MKRRLKVYFNIFGCAGLLLAALHANDLRVVLIDLGIAALGFGIAFFIPKK